MPHRAFVLVNELAFRHFHRRWREIDRMWPPVDDFDHYEAVRSLRESSRNELRAEIRRLSELGYAGSFLVPV